MRKTTRTQAAALSQQAKPRSWVMYLMAALIVMVLGASVFFTYYWLTQTNEFIDDIVQRTMEGNKAEESGLETAILAHISSDVRHEPGRSVFSEIVEDARNNLISACSPPLRISSRPIKDLSPYLVGDIAPEQHESAIEALLDLLSRTDLDKLEAKAFGLHPTSHNGLPFLESEKGARSYLRVPNPLLLAPNVDSTISPRTKRDLITARIVELFTSQAIRRRSKDGDKLSKAGYSYFIPPSGLLRIFPTNNSPPKVVVSAQNTFSNTTYFDATLLAEKDMMLRTSHPYLDLAGMGLVRTHSAFIKCDDPRIEGLLCLDEQIKSREQVFDSFRAGSPISAVTIGEFRSGEPVISGSPPILTRLHKEVFGNEDLAKGRILKVTDGKVSAFSVPLGGRKFGTFVIDPEKSDLKYLIFQILAFAAVGGIAVFLAYARHLKNVAVSARTAQEDIAENIHGGFALVDGAGGMIEHNSTLESILGNRGIDRGMGIEAWMTEGTASEYRRRVLSEPEGFEFPGELRSNGSATTPAIVSSAPVRGSHAGSRMVISLPSSQLEVTIASKFIHVFSHALKTPLHSILLLADRLRRRTAPEQQDLYFGVLQRQMGELKELIENTLRFSSLESGSVNLQREHTDVARMLRTICKTIDERLARTDVALEQNIPENLRTSLDPTLIRVVFNNVIENALKYTERGFIRVEAKSSATDICIRVSDTGLGIADDEKERIFDLFYRGGDGRVRSRDGIGLGLYVSRKYIELHHGSISCQDFREPIPSSKRLETKKEWTGTTFVMTLPLGYTGGDSSHGGNNSETSSHP